MKTTPIVKGIINYIFAMLFAVIFGLFLNADVGWFILLTLILAPLLSVLFAWMSSKMISVSCRMEESLLSKGDSCNMTITVENRSIFPTTPVKIVLTNEPGVKSENPQILVSVLPRGKHSFDVSFRAKICGKSTIGIKEVRATDYLGIFSLAVKNMDYTDLQRSVAVIPDVAELSARDDNLIRVMQASNYMDDGEDTIESATYSFGGFPGYDNREYVPGDPVKRINWKQSAKRNKLLVRLDDEVATRAVNIVLDSVFNKEKADVQGAAFLHQYHFLERDEIVYKVAEDAIENALGMIAILIRHNYSVNFYVRMNKEFTRYEILDEVDLEDLKLDMAYYEYADSENVERLPLGTEGFGEKVGVFSTPNSYEDASSVLEKTGANAYTTIYAVLEEARKLYNEGGSISLDSLKKGEEEPAGWKKKMLNSFKSVFLSLVLGFLLSIIVFSVFNIPFASPWTVLQAIVCIIAVIYCESIKEHKIIGTLLTTLLLWWILSAAIRAAFGEGLLNYMHWFMSGGRSVPNNNQYLLSLLLIFTTFFAIVIYYFSCILYRTSFLLLVSLIPFVVYVKVMLDIPTEAVVFVTVLNVAVFLKHYRTESDAGKRIVGYLSGFVSLLGYIVFFVAIGLALPDADTKYYYMFENAFMGGNVSEKVPQEYSEESEYSGNAEGFNDLNDRKLYVIKSVEPNADLYMNRQFFDVYDFENDRWYPMEGYAELIYSKEEWYDIWEKKSVSGFINAMNCAAKYEPYILEKYHMPFMGDTEEAKWASIEVEATNFQNVGYVTPTGAVNVSVQHDKYGDDENTFVTASGIFRRRDGYLQPNIRYYVSYYDEKTLVDAFVSRGGANMDLDTLFSFCEELKVILETNGEADYAQVVESVEKEAREALAYRQLCEENVKSIPMEVRELAEDITKDCKYEWEKAIALQKYFRENGFVYDLSYKSPDHHIEYFLFEDKTGTCSDFATAYTLMARAVGLTVKYAEGFVADEEYNGDYVIRTNNSHAYPQVYIPNVGYVVFEATLPAEYVRTPGRKGVGITSYFVTALVQAVSLFVFVSAGIVLVLFLHKVASPFIREIVFLGRVKRAANEKAVALVYRRIQHKYTKDLIKRPQVLTPYEYALVFEENYGYDISELCFMLEKAAYTKEELMEEDKRKALNVYGKVKEYVNQSKKKKEQKMSKI